MSSIGKPNTPISSPIIRPSIISTIIYVSPRIRFAQWIIEFFPIKKIGITEFLLWFYIMFFGYGVS